MGPRPGPSYLETDHKHDWSEKTGRTAASNLVAVARGARGEPDPATSGLRPDRRVRDVLMCADVTIVGPRVVR
jgi:hypothetical protein